MDTPSSFFFNLKKNVARRKHMACLKLPGGRVIADPGEMRKHAVDFYNVLFGAEDCDKHCVAELLAGLPQLSLGEKAAIDKNLSLEELTTAVVISTSPVLPPQTPGKGEGVGHVVIDSCWGLWFLS
ncbi:hypothetical protein AAFF_G00397110 [Aldrovandia affinis]|uniref:Uncharacterized protein n=1 Tax=Aldrovandia affinis TaxID=143900 RepID=A0AAD7SD98_9TELE|nr:hypothetical protein AAFF_G00397110 [Aldrovandia affinis]